MRPAGVISMELHATCQADAAASACGRGTREVDEFQLPLGGLYADLELGTSSLRPPAECLQAPSLVQLQILAGWQRDLDAWRDRALQRLARELGPGGDDGNRAEQLRQLRRSCAALHIELPDDFGHPPAGP